MVVGENKRTNIMDGIENTGDVRLHDHRLRLKQRFDIVRKLGQGTYGKVQLGINKKTGQEVAIKTIKKCKIESEADLIRIRREVQIMSSVRHPNIVHIYEVFENSEKMILVMEYCSGGELYDYLSERKVLQEDEARRLFRQIATAAYYCHIHKICHRDLKLENVLLDETGSAKIADFGLSNVFKETSLLSTFCGSPLYASPEIVKGTPYIGPEVDCWSLGVLLYTLVYGAMPFDGSNFKRLVRQISNGDYYEPKNPSSASHLIRDMLTVDPLKRADIAFICDNQWVNVGFETSCLEEAQALAAQTPVRLDLLLSLAPAANHTLLLPAENEMNPEESGTDLTSSTSMAVEPSNSAEKRILDLVAEGGEDAIKPSPTRTIVSSNDNKRKLEIAMSTSGLQKKKELATSSAKIPTDSSADEQQPSPISMPGEAAQQSEQQIQPSLQSSATMTLTPSPTTSANEVGNDKKELEREEQRKEEANEQPSVKPKVTVKKKTSPSKSFDEKSPERQETKGEIKPSSVATAAEKLASANTQQGGANQTVPKPKKFSIPGGNVGSFKEQFERRASLTTTPEVKKPVTKPVLSKIAKPKAQSEDRDLPMKQDNGTVRLQQIGVEPSQSPPQEMNRGVKKTESEPSHCSTTADPSLLLQDARRSLQNSMAKLVEEKTGEETRRRAARDIISTAIRTGKPPMPYSRSSSTGTSSPPHTPPARVYRTEAHHVVPDQRATRGVSVERIIPISVLAEESPSVASSISSASRVQPVPRPQHAPLRRLKSNDSAGSGSETSIASGGGSGGGSGGAAAAGEPIKKSAREFIIPIAVEGGGYVTPRQRSIEPEAARPRPSQLHRRISSLVSGGESEEEEEKRKGVGEESMHRLRSSRAARAESVSSGEEDEEDEGFHLLTAENLFSTLLHRVRALTNRLNGEEGPGFQHHHSLFNNLQSPFFNSPHLPRRSLLREGWGPRDLHADFDSMFSKARQTPRGSNKKSSKHQTKGQQVAADTNPDAGLDLSDLDLSSIEFSEKEIKTLSGLTPALSKRLQQQLLAHLPPAAARSLRRTLSLHNHTANQAQSRDKRYYHRSLSATKPSTTQADESITTNPPAKLDIEPKTIINIEKPLQKKPTNDTIDASDIKNNEHKDNENTANNDLELEIKSPEPQPAHVKLENIFDTESNDLPAFQFCTLPRLKRHSTLSRESTPLSNSTTGYDPTPKIGSLAKELSNSRASSIRSTPDRPLLSKYLTPERTLSLDEPYSSDSGSLLSDPSYIAAYGSPSLGSFRRHSMKLSGDPSRKRISRFLRPDFFDTPPDESMYAKHKKEKELETQKILREIREKRNKSLESTLKSPTEMNDIQQLFKDESSSSNRKCLSPLGIITAKERSRSNTPFFPILDGIKESAIDSSFKNYKKPLDITDTIDNSSSKESKLSRPKSYPIKQLDSLNEVTQEFGTETSSKELEDNEKSLQRESKLLRPKSYPISSSSPEKVYISHNFKNDESSSIAPQGPSKEIVSKENKNDIEVSFSISLPKKKILVTSIPEPLKLSSSLKQKSDMENQKCAEVTDSLNLKKYKIVEDEKLDSKNDNPENGSVISNGKPLEEMESNSSDIKSNGTIKENSKTNLDSVEKKGTIKKKIIKKVSSKSKLENSISSSATGEKTIEKKKVTKKVKEKSDDATAVTKKKSMFQTIGHKLEKFTSNKSSSPEKVSSGINTSIDSKKLNKISRKAREQSVPVNNETNMESTDIKRAASFTNLPELDNQVTTTPSKTTVSKVLGLFRKSEPSKDKSSKQPLVKTISESQDSTTNNLDKINNESVDIDKPKRPTSLLLNGLGNKNKYGRTASDSVAVVLDQGERKKEIESKNVRNSLKLDFSKLPRVKKIVPSSSALEPQVSFSANEKDTDRIKDNMDLNLPTNEEIIERACSKSRSRSRSRSIISNSETKPENIVDNRLPPSTFDMSHYPNRQPEPTSPDKDDIVDRIHRKSFYTRFNEKKHRRKSSLVGPGATEYDPMARINAPASDTKCEMSPTSPISYDISPGYTLPSEISPSTERFRSFMTDLPISPKNYGYNDKIDTYRSLDRNDFRKLPGCRAYLDYDQPSYSTHRYNRTKSLLDNADGIEDRSLGHLRDPPKYNRTVSMYSPGNYVTYRPNRSRNSAILLKESEKEPSPENILERIRQRKRLSSSVTRKPEAESEHQVRSPDTLKGESDRTERPEKNV